MRLQRQVVAAAATLLLFVAVGIMPIFASMSLPDGIDNILGFEPKSSFKCEHDGYFGDVENDCRLFHLCQKQPLPNGRTQWHHWTYACGNQTMFNQLTLTCAFVDEAIPCKHAPRFQYLNEVIHRPKEPFLTDADVTSGISYYGNSVLADGARARAFEDSSLMAQLGATGSFLESLALAQQQQQQQQQQSQQLQQQQQRQQQHVQTSNSIADHHHSFLLTGDARANDEHNNKKQLDDSSAPRAENAMQSSKQDSHQDRAAGQQGALFATAAPAAFSPFHSSDLTFNDWKQIAATDEQQEKHKSQRSQSALDRFAHFAPTLLATAPLPPADAVTPVADMQPVPVASVQLPQPHSLQTHQSQQQQQQQQQSQLQQAEQSPQNFDFSFSLSHNNIAAYAPTVAPATNSVAAGGALHVVAAPESVATQPPPLPATVAVTDDFNKPVTTTVDAVAQPQQQQLQAASEIPPATPPTPQNSEKAAADVTQQLPTTTLAPQQPASTQVPEPAKEQVASPRPEQAQSHSHRARRVSQRQSRIRSSSSSFHSTRLSANQQQQQQQPQQQQPPQKQQQRQTYEPSIIMRQHDAERQQQHQHHHQRTTSNNHQENRTTVDISSNQNDWRQLPSGAELDAQLFAPRFESLSTRRRV